MNFQKKALALVLAVLMILSSVSALAFAVPNSSKLAQSNQEAIKNVNVDTSVKTVTGSFPDDPTDKHGDQYYKNVLYSPQATAKKGWHGKYYGFYWASAEVCYSNSSVIMVDGQTKPTVPVMIKFSMDKDYPTYFFARYLRLNGTETIGSFDIGATWNRITESNKRKDSYNFPDSIEGFAFDFANSEGGQNLSSSEQARAYANVLTLKKTYTDDQFTDVLNPEFSFQHASNLSGWSGTQTLVGNHPVYVVNYKPLKTALEEAQRLINLVKKNQDLYTNASVKELVRLTNVLLAAKPDKILASKMSNGNITDVNAAVNAYEDAASAAINEWNKWCNGNVEGGLVKATVELVDVTSQSFVLDYGNKLSYNINDNAAQQGEAEISYVAYSTAAKDLNVNVDSFVGSEVIAPNKEIQLKNGVCTLDENGNLTYKVTNAQFTEPDSIYVLAKIKVNAEHNGFKWEKVTFIPANSIYIEDDSAVFTYTPEEAWQNANTSAQEALQDADKADADKIYGSDSHYENCDKYSAGNAKTITVTKDTKATVEFEFTGTGFDVISVASNNSGVFTVDVYQGSKRVKAAFVNTYNEYSYDGNTWVKGNGDTLYQIPAIKMDGLEYNTYRVVITPRLSSMNNAESCEFTFDGVRIYNPMKNAEADKIYQANGEANAIYMDFKDKAKSDAEFNEQLANGMAILDTPVSDITEINNISPNHELYLNAGQVITFNVAANKAPKSIQVGAKKVNGAPALSVNYAETKINTATDMFYEINVVGQSEGSKWVSSVITIQNTGTGVLSLTSLKLTFDNAVAASDASVFANRETIRMAKASLNAPKADLTVNAKAPVVADKTVTINATTSLDVAKLNVLDVNGNAVDAKVECTVNGNVKNWTVVIVEETAGEYTYTLQGEYVNGYTNASTDVTVTIEEAAVPAPQLTFGQKVVNFFKKIFGIKF